MFVSLDTFVQLNIQKRCKQLKENTASGHIQQKTFRAVLE